jgi:hypothetical protein
LNFFFSAQGLEIKLNYQKEREISGKKSQLRPPTVKSETNFQLRTKVFAIMCLSAIILTLMLFFFQFQAIRLSKTCTYTELKLLKILTN